MARCTPDSDRRAGRCSGIGGASCPQDEYSTTGLPLPLRPEPGVEDCDEYPFRSTLEGAASQAWDFSVYPVNLSQNRSAGNTLMNYVRNYRILAWDDTLPDPANSNDRYYVQIVDF